MPLTALHADDTAGDLPGKVRNLPADDKPPSAGHTPGKAASEDVTAHAVGSSRNGVGAGRCGACLALRIQESRAEHATGCCFGEFPAGGSAAAGFFDRSRKPGCGQPLVPPGVSPGIRGPGARILSGPRQDRPCPTPAASCRTTRNEAAGASLGSVCEKPADGAIPGTRA